jgi:cyanophycin synthetase
MDGRKVGWGSGEDPEQLSIWLLDPEIQALVIHVSLSTIVEQGLPYHRADVGVVLEAEGLAPAGHLRDQDDLAYALAVTVEEVRQAGAAILNADDPHVLDMAGRLYARPVFFTRDRQLRFVSEHITDGHLAVVLTGDRVTLEQRRDVQEVVRLGADGLPAADHPDSTVWLGVVAVLAGLGWTPWSIGQALRNVAARRCG